MPRELPRSFYLLLFVVLILGNVSIYREIFAAEVLKVSILEVGKKGSAVLMRSPSGATIPSRRAAVASVIRAS